MAHNPPPARTLVVHTTEGREVIVKDHLGRISFEIEPMLFIGQKETLEFSSWDYAELKRFLSRGMGI